MANGGAPGFELRSKSVLLMGDYVGNADVRRGQMGGGLLNERAKKKALWNER